MNQRQALALGRAPNMTQTGTGTLKQPLSLEERLSQVESHLKAMSEAFYQSKRALQDKDHKSAYTESGEIISTANKDGLPVGATFIGISKGIPHILSIAENGDYYIGQTKYPSLSAAAQAVSGVRRSGWAFWRLPDGKSLKEVFKR